MEVIYIDSPIFKKSQTGRKSYAHMVASSLSELHDFAPSIDVKPHFFHKHKRLSHYDITSDQHVIALQKGAKLVSTRELIAISYVMNAPPRDIIVE